MGEHEADFIHMGIQHDPQPLPAARPAFTGSQHISQRIDLYLVSEGTYMLQYDCAHFALIA
jgi:hypothetical protein